MGAGSDDAVGYGRPPKASRWKKGQSGNPRRRRRQPSSECALAMIDRLLIAPITLKINGESERLPTIKAILLQLTQKELAGDARAARVLLKYSDFAAQHSKRQFEVVYVDSEYTQALSNRSGPSEEGK